MSPAPEISRLRVEIEIELARLDGLVARMLQLRREARALAIVERHLQRPKRARRPQ